MSDITEQTQEEIRAAILAEFTAERAALTAQAEELIAAQVATIPEHLRGLVPVGISTTEQLAWIAKAKAAHPATTATIPATDNRRPNNTTTPPDFAELSPISRMAAGYKNTNSNTR